MTNIQSNMLQGRIAEATDIYVRVPFLLVILSSSRWVSMPVVTSYVSDVSTRECVCGAAHPNRLDENEMCDATILWPG